MYGIEILNREHENILTMTEILRAICIRIMDTKQLPEKDLRRCIHWIREYADTHHHGKEEAILFREMTAHLGPAADKLVNGAMLIEHDMGRFHMQELKKALDTKKSDDQTLLDVITHAAGYAELLVRHAGKEDKVVYPFAERQLAQDILDRVDKDSRAFEENFDVQPYLEELSDLAAAYL